jgi:hypothetical protein
MEFALGLLILFPIIIFFIFHESNEKNKRKEFKLQHDELIDRFLEELSTFKKTNNFNLQSAIKNESSYFWLFEDKLCSVHYLGVLSEISIDYSPKVPPKDFIFNELRNFHRVPYFTSLEDSEFDKFRGIKIPVEKIVYFTAKGELFKNTSVSGGGSSLGGAIVGGVLAGGVGAVIGSRKQVESGIITTDNREVILVYYEGEKLTKKKFSYETLDVFDQLIPEKNYEFIQMQNIQKK